PTHRLGSINRTSALTPGALFADYRRSSEEGYPQSHAPPAARRLVSRTALAEHFRVGAGYTPRFDIPARILVESPGLLFAVCGCCACCGFGMADTAAVDLINRIHAQQNRPPGPDRHKIADVAGRAGTQGCGHSG